MNYLNTFKNIALMLSIIVNLFCLYTLYSYNTTLVDYVNVTEQLHQETLKYNQNVMEYNKSIETLTAHKLKQF